MAILFFVAVLLVLLTAFIVFGGGQIFMPIYKWIFELLINNFGANMHNEQIDQLFAVANATPGIIGTKLAFFTGYLISYDSSGTAQWWGYLAMFVTYLVIAIPAILIMHFTMKAFTKNASSPYFIAINKYLKPVLAGIMFSLAIQLLLSVMIPYLSFNSTSNYAHINYESVKAIIFKGWRQYALYVWVPVAIILTIYLQRKKVPLIYLILGSILIGFIIFEPWLK